MVRIRTTYSSQKEEIQTYRYDLPEIGKYIFTHVNHKDLADALGHIKWEEIMNNETMSTEELTSVLAEIVVEAAI